MANILDYIPRPARVPEHVLKMGQQLKQKDMSNNLTSLPEKWCIKNDHQEVRDYLAIKYKEPDILNWNYSYIGWDNAGSYNGCHGAPSTDIFYPGTVEITYDQFKKWVLKEGKGGAAGTKPDASGFKFNVGDYVELKPTGIEWCDLPDKPTQGLECGNRESCKNVIVLRREIAQGNNWYRTENRHNWIREDGILKCNTVASTPDKTHNKENLLEEAKRRYPVGTRYRTYQGHEYSIKTNSVYQGVEGLKNYGDGVNIGIKNGGFLYYEGKWAEIIIKPEEETVPEYVECVKDRGMSTITTGKIYKAFHKNTSIGRQGFINNYGREDCFGAEYFKPSTRQAYEAQQNKKSVSVDNEEFKVGDWVTFLPEVAKKLGYYTTFWNEKWGTRVVKEITNGGKDLYFGGCSNYKKCFRKATPAEIASVTKKEKMIDVETTPLSSGAGIGDTLLSIGGSKAIGYAPISAVSYASAGGSFSTPFHYPSHLLEMEDLFKNISRETQPSGTNNVKHQKPITITNKSKSFKIQTV